MMYLAILGDENFNYIGNIVMNSKEYNHLIQKIEDKEEWKNKYKIVFNNTLYIIDNTNIIDYLYYGKPMKLNLDAHNEIVTIINENFKGIRNINELFERLEKEGVKIENKDEILI